MSDTDETEGRGDTKRARRKRPRGWYEKALKAGEIREPGSSRPPTNLPPGESVVFDVPLAESAGDGKEPG